MGLFKKLKLKKQNKRIGKYGERKVKKVLNPLLFVKVKHYLINNLTIIDDLKKSHQIDHIEIRKNGIFVIETKNIAGRIFGTEKSDEWLQVLYKKTNNHKNPIKQNESHVYHIRKILNNKYPVKSVIVMVQNNAGDLNIDNVVNLKNLRRYLRKQKSPIKLSKKEMKQIYIKLIQCGDNISNRKHLKNIKKTQKQLKKGICPRCGNKLIERESIYGNFIGCSNYPKCTFKMTK